MAGRVEIFVTSRFNNESSRDLDNVLHKESINLSVNEHKFDLSII